MSFEMLLLLAVGLAMDAFAVSITNGMCYANAGKKTAVLSALFFGFFQGFMPLLGFLAGLTFRGPIAFLDHWIALVLLSFIGGQMIWGALKEKNDQPQVSCRSNKILTVKSIFLQAIATSIDALTVGIGFAVMEIEIWSAASLIAAVTFLCSLVGAAIGKSFGSFVKEKAEIFGGVILIAIGVKIFLEHIFGL